MKTLSGTFAFVALAVIVIVAVVSCCNFPFITDTKSYAYVQIGHELRAKIPKRTYVEWKDQTKFDKALEQVRGHNGEYCLCVMMNPDDKPHPYDSYNNCPPGYKCPPGNIRTVKVTKSKAADNIAAGESAVNDPNVTYRVQSPVPGDIIKVLDALKQ
jgi:hypothetical protein